MLCVLDPQKKNLLERIIFSTHKIGFGFAFFLDHTTRFLSVKLLIFSYSSVLTYVLGAQKNCLNETVLLSTHNICFG